MDHSPGSSSPKSRKHIMGHNSDELDELLASFDPVTHKLIDMGDNVMGLMPDMAKSGDQLINDSPLRKETHAYSPAILDNVLKNDFGNDLKNQNKKRMSVAEMKGALQHLQDVRWKNSSPASHLKHFQDTLLSSKHRKIFLAAMFHLDGQHRQLSAIKISDYFTWWKMHTMLWNAQLVAASETSGNESEDVVESSFEMPTESSTLNGTAILLKHNKQLLKSIEEGEKADEKVDTHLLRASGAKNVIITYMKQCVRRRLEFGFHHWVWITNRVLTKRALERRTVQLNLDDQKSRAREFQLDGMMAVNVQLTNAITCSHAFFHWKIQCIQSIYIEKQEMDTTLQRALYTELKLLKKQLFEKNEENRCQLQESVKHGKKLADKVHGLKDKVSSAASLTQSINASCYGGKKITIARADAEAHQTKKPKIRWNMIQSHFGLTASEVKK